MLVLAWVEGFGVGTDGVCVGRRLRCGDRTRREWDWERSPCGGGSEVSGFTQCAGMIQHIFDFV